MAALRIDVCLGSAEFWRRLRADAARARRRVLVQTLSFEGDTAGKGLAAAMLSSPAADRRIAVDSFTRWIVNDRFVWLPAGLLDGALQAEVRETGRMIEGLRAGGVRVAWMNPVGPLGVRILARNHKKIIVIDDDIAYFGGINFSDHNFAWHDMMLRVEHAGVAAFLAEDFEATWAGRGMCAARRFDGLAFQLLDGRTNETAFGEAMGLIDGARRSILIESPYLTFPFSDRIRAAAERGVRVQLVVPAVNNIKVLDDLMIWEAERSGIELWRFPRMTHLKAMLVDDETLVVGSSNFDYLSYRLHQELLAVITEPRVVAEFRQRVLLPDLAASTRCTRRVGDLRGRLRRAQIKLLGDFSALAGR